LRQAGATGAGDRATGSGKSTTLRVLDKINAEREEHMITIEGPIEFLHNHKKMPGEPARSARGHDIVCETRCAPRFAKTPT